MATTSKKKPPRYFFSSDPDDVSAGWPVSDAETFRKELAEEGVVTDRPVTFHVYQHIGTVIAKPSSVYIEGWEDLDFPG